jgi:MSHA biogenesis protein MshJ
MSFNTNLIKIQFKVDHATFSQRVAVLLGLLLVIIAPWYFLAYTPQSNEAMQVQQQINELKDQTIALENKYKMVLALVESHQMDKVLIQYDVLKKEMEVLNQQIQHYHHRFISDKDLAQLLHSMLVEMKNIHIKSFITVIKEPPKEMSSANKEEVEKATSAAKVPAKAAPQTTKTAPLPLPNIKRYSLTLSGDYFSILQFLKRIEDLKWQLFWTQLNYHVDQYPQATATVDFYTLMPMTEPTTTSKEAEK